MAEEDDFELPRTPSFIPPEDTFPMPAVPKRPTSPLLLLDSSPASPPQTFPEGPQLFPTIIPLSPLQGAASDSENSPPTKRHRDTSPQPLTSQQSSSEERDRKAMPPPLVPLRRLPALPRLTTYEIVTLFAVNSVRKDRRVDHLIETWRYKSLKQRRPIRTLNSFVRSMARAEPDHDIMMGDYVTFVMQDLDEVKKGEEVGKIHLKTFESTRALYFSMMIGISETEKKQIVNPSYHWGHLARIIAVTAAIAREMAGLPGRRNLYSDLLGWCVYFFKAWHIDVWLENKGGWEAIVQDNLDSKLLTEVQVTTHPSRESTPSPEHVSSDSSLPSPSSLLSHSPPTPPSPSSQSSPPHS